MNAFLNIFNVSRFIVNRITKIFQTEGIFEEKQGGLKL